MAKTVMTFSAIMGGVAYRVSVSKDTAYYSTKSHYANTWKVKAKEPIAAFQAWAESYNLFSPYEDDNPALVHYRIQYLLHDYTVF
jgi:hypothetical protein